jgi:hypothetical protein
VTRQLKTPIAFVILLGILAFGGWYGYHLVVTGERPVLPDPCVTVSVAELKPSNVSVRVYNGGTLRGLATDTGKQLKSAGFIVTSTGNTDRAINDTVIVGYAADSPEVQFVASWFVRATIEADGRQDHSVDILVGEAGGELVANPPQSYVVPSGQACVPQDTLPSAGVTTPTAEATPE